MDALSEHVDVTCGFCGRAMHVSNIGPRGVSYSCETDQCSVIVAWKPERVCICDGGPQGEGCFSLPHEPHCPLAQT